MNKLSIVLLFFILTACSPMPEGTVSQRETAAVAQMEKSGALPELDRSDSLGGVDADHNGIRDDIDAWIAGQRYNEPQKKAAQQYARALQVEIVTPFKMREEARKSFEISDRAMNCIYSVNGKFAYEISKKIINLTTNTRERILKQERDDRLANGMVFKGYFGQDTCE